MNALTWIPTHVGRAPVDGPGDPAAGVRAEQAAARPSTRSSLSRLSALSAICLCGCSSGRVASEQASPEPPSWFVALGTGYGDVESDVDDGGDLGGGWRLAFSGGMVLGEHWLLGLELGGIGLEAANLWDPEEGRGLSDGSVVAEYHPSLDGGWYLHGGLGFLDYYDNDLGPNPLDGSGWGGRVGVGYEWSSKERYHVALLATLGTGEIDAQTDWEPRTVMVSLIWSYR